MDKHIVADFVGGPWDGKSYDIPFMREWRVALLRELKFIKKRPESIPDKVHYDVAVYRYVLNGIYWFAGIEKHE